MPPDDPFNKPPNFIGIDPATGSDYSCIQGSDGTPSHDAPDGTYYVNRNTGQIFVRRNNLWLSTQPTSIQPTSIGGVIQTQVQTASAENRRKNIRAVGRALLRIRVNVIDATKVYSAGSAGSPGFSSDADLAAVEAHSRMYGAVAVEMLRSVGISQQFRSNADRRAFAEEFGTELIAPCNIEEVVAVIETFFGKF